MKTRKLTAILLALCMLLSLSISAFAADDAIASGTIQDSKITWKLDDKGWLTISGSGDCSAFASKDDQPWAEYRSQITQVWFDGMESLAIPDLAYWFEDCTNLTTAEIPSTTPVIGRHAFYNCPLLAKLSIYYGEHTLDSIGENAFWRENDSGDTLYIGYLIGYPKSSVPFHTYDWAASNRSERYFYDLYGVYQNADAGSAATSGIKKAPGISVQSTGTIIGNCPSCGKYAFQGTYVEVAHSSRGHANYNECNSCHYVQYLGTYTTKSHGAGGYGSGTCPDCGSHTWILQNVQDATCTSNGYRSYSCACGQTKSDTIYSSGHSYSYGSWEEYSSSQHRRESYCRNCGASSYDYASHSLSYGSWSNDSSSQHSRTVSCYTCGYSTTDYGSHSYSTGSWSKYSDTQHRRSKTCSGCGATDYDYANHSYSYGNWSKYDETQHRRTKTCSACSDSDYEYGDHRDSNADGVCDDCGANVALIVTWDAASNGGTVGGKNSVTTSVAPNQTAVAPGYTPVKAGHTFSGWYTEKTNGALYNTVTITAARTFYAQFAPAEYKITWDLGTGKTETSNQTYGEKLNLPAEPARKGYAFLGWFTQETGGTQVDGNTVFKEVASTTYYAHWEEATVFSVIVPAVLPVTVDQNGKVYVSNAEIVNHSTAAVQVSSVTLTAENGWTLVPYASDMSHAKVDSNQIGFKINSAQTSKTGSMEQFELTSPWQINEEESLTLTYDAVVSALSQPVTNANILSVLFVVEWA
jgi:uncharacterized repeat protein (TIGR02543 family)